MKGWDNIKTTVHYLFDIYQIKDGEKTIEKTFSIELPHRISNDYLTEISLKTARALGYTFPLDDENAESGIEYRVV